jgi:amino acid transporter
MLMRFNKEKNIMKKNIGTVDKVLRLVVAAVVGVLYYTGNIEGILAIILGVAAAVFILTAFISFCPLYAIFGMSSCGKCCKDKEEKEE